MYKRFLNNNDYIGIITEEALLQLIRGNEERIAQAEEAAESSVIVPNIIEVCSAPKFITVLVTIPFSSIESDTVI